MYQQSIVNCRSDVSATDMYVNMGWCHHRTCANSSVTAMVAAPYAPHVSGFNNSWATAFGATIVLNKNRQRSRSTTPYMDD